MAVAIGIAQTRIDTPVASSSASDAPPISDASTKRSTITWEASGHT